MEIPPYPPDDPHELDARPGPETTEWRLTGHHLLQFFEHAHLPPELADVSKHFAELASVIVLKCPRNFSAVTALRKLLESKDAAVRAVKAGS